MPNQNKKAVVRSHTLHSIRTHVNVERGLVRRDINDQPIYNQIIKEIICQLIKIVQLLWLAIFSKCYQVNIYKTQKPNNRSCSASERVHVAQWLNALRYTQGRARVPVP